MQELPADKPTYTRNEVEDIRYQDFLDLARVAASTSDMVNRTIISVLEEKIKDTDLLNDIKSTVAQRCAMISLELMSGNLDGLLD